MKNEIEIIEAEIVEHVAKGNIKEITNLNMDFASADVELMNAKFDKIDQIAECIKARLVEGNNKDYMLIPSTGKPSLLISGAQKLAILFGLKPTYEQQPGTIIDHENGFAIFIYKCVLTHRQSGEVVAEAIAATNTMEKSGGKANFYDLINNKIQMAQKRAMIRATREYGNLSQVFTQDMDALKNEPLNKFDAMKIFSQLGKKDDNRKALESLVVDRYNEGKKDDDKIVGIMAGATVENKGMLTGIAKRVGIEYREGRLPIKPGAAAPKPAKKKPAKKTTQKKKEVKVKPITVESFTSDKQKRNLRDYVKRNIKKGNEIDTKATAIKYNCTEMYVMSFIERYK